MFTQMYCRLFSPLIAFSVLLFIRKTAGCASTTTGTPSAAPACFSFTVTEPFTCGELVAPGSTLKIKSGSFSNSDVQQCGPLESFVLCNFPDAASDGTETVGGFFTSCTDGASLAVSYQIISDICESKSIPVNQVVEVCNATAACTTVSRRLTEDNAPVLERMTPSSLEHQEFVRDCGKEEYNAFLFAKQHVFAVFRPISSESNCPPVVYDFEFNGFASRNGKLFVDIIPDPDVLDSRFPQDESSFTGTHTLNQVAKSIYSFKENTGQWDLFRNSCFQFAVHMIRSLGWDIDNGLLSYFSERLLQNHSRENLQQVFATDGFQKLFDEHGALLQKAFESYFGHSDGVVIGEEQAAKFLKEVMVSDHNEPKMQRMLSVFYVELVEHYARYYVRVEKE